MPVADLIEQESGDRVWVRTEAPEMLAALLRAHGAQVTTGGGTLVVGGMDAVRIGKVAVEHQIALSQLTDMTASLEEAYFRLTSDSVDYAAPQQEEDSAWQR